MPELEIDGRKVTVDVGRTLLDAARQLQIDVPTLCYHDGYPSSSSCMVCLVKDEKTGKLIPSCTAPAADGMVISASTDEVIEARRNALELLLGEHVGDCEGPCHRICPAHMEIPLMIRLIASGRLREAASLVKRDIALPAVLGRICPAPCEKGCRRRLHDGPVSICLLKRYVADIDLASGNPWQPERQPPTGKTVAIVGAGPAGLAAAWHLAQDGHKCVVFDEHELPGGALRLGVDTARLPHEVLDAEIDTIRSLGVRFSLGTRVGESPTLDGLANEYHAVLVAVGELTGDKAKALGLELRDRGIAVSGRSHATSREGIFAAGAAVTPTRMAVRALAGGKAAAAAINQFLSGEAVIGEPPTFNTQVGVLGEGEIDEFMKGVGDHARVEPTSYAAGFTDAEAVGEAARCVHCDCRKPSVCALRRLSKDHRARPQGYRGDERHPFQRVLQHAEVVYEPGKCIRCGQCVEAARRLDEPLGLAFVGRGFGLRIDAALGASIQEALRTSAAECVRVCPTGALAFSEGEDT